MSETVGYSGAPSVEAMMHPGIVHVVDDEPAIRRSIGFMLKAAGLHPVPWESGDDLLEHIDDLERGCILLDMRMPGADGLEVQRRLAARGCSLPVIIMTGHAEAHLTTRAMRAGAIDFLNKPFERAVLVALCEEAEPSFVAAKLSLSQSRINLLRAHAVSKLEAPDLDGALKIMIAAGLC
ncbi:response regulator transcription factor [Sphingomonas sp. MMS24-J13]|uniref:response regulator transcription factor n=1 Tax=Sphingomonas sp. MMS24-J13 TaxID=3238686 RepID=UPI0038505014